MVSACNVALVENHSGGNGHDLDTRDPAASAIRSTDVPGLETIGSGGVDKYFGHRSIRFDVKRDGLA